MEGASMTGQQKEDALQALKELRGYPLNLHELKCLDTIEMFVRSRPAPALNEDTWDPAIHGYCGDIQMVKAELEELKMVNAMLEAEIDRLTGIETEAARQARRDVLNVAIGILKEGAKGMPDFIIPEVKQGKIDSLEWAIEKLESLRGGEP